MKFTLEIDMDNAAFDELPFTELGLMLKKIADYHAKLDWNCGPNLEWETFSKDWRDYNGNTVGTSTVIRGDDD